MVTDLISATSNSHSDAGPQNWSDLPNDLLHSILLRLFFSQDLLAFSSVCRSWHSFATSTIPAFPTSLFAPLFISPDLKHRSRGRRRTVTPSFRVPNPAIPRASRNAFDPSPVEESIISIPFLTCSHDHYLFLTRRRKILMANIITGFQITSPVLPLDHRPPSADSCLALLTSPVSYPNCTLIFLTIDCLFLWKINSPDWISLPLGVRLTKLRQMIVVGRKIVVVGRKVWTLELGNMLELPQYLCPKELVVQCPTQNILPSFENAQLVDCDGEILYVCFTTSSGRFIFVTKHKVEVFRVDMVDDHMLLVKKDNLGNRALYLSMAVNVPGCVLSLKILSWSCSNLIFLSCQNKNKKSQINNTEVFACLNAYLVNSKQIQTQAGTTIAQENQPISQLIGQVKSKYHELKIYRLITSDLSVLEERHELDQIYTFLDALDSSYDTLKA
ncbi:hypothetical protein LUZ61_014328 [Rhynchospora tenuis]|uniref:F-box domain-containing protein n=1 Tax=Rhynchospora tenuis TaxID=198213 RepID=A0AAD5Z372_9POAL|nr:hypothetical protein LUZ61_014328 [Rhynchospora tenuis]